MRTDRAYDTRGQVLKTTAYGNVDAAGNGVADRRAFDHPIRLRPGRPAPEDDPPAGGTTQYTYDGLGRRLTALDARASSRSPNTTTPTRGRLFTLASGLTTTSAFDRAGRLVSVLDSSAAIANLGQTTYFYDADSRLRMTQDPTGVRQWTVYDDIGRKTADVDATGRLTEYAYEQAIG